ncbi:GGDEF domain-containing protein [Chitinimonas sp.]|uniref:GGDEF domain-containing protein n=1 Tax=Chitinimonas sp. TaxID=1934313 RepID=UPI002F925809
MTDPLVLLGITGLFCLLNLLALGSLLRRDESVRYFLAANLMLAVAILGFCLRPWAPAWLSIVLANALNLAGHAMLVLGCQCYFARPLRVWRLLLPAVMALLIMASFYYLRDDYPMRVLASSLYCAYASLCIALTIGRYWPRERPRYSYAFTAGLAWLCTGLHLWRGGSHIWLLSGEHAAAEANLASMVFVTIGSLLMPAVSVGLIMMVHDRIAARLEGIASRDYLTGTLSRRAWMQAFEASLQLGSQPLSVAVLDIDHFKRINDRHGHAAGDAVLRQFAGLAGTLLRHEDALGRLGGEEFVILFERTEPATAHRIVQRLRAQVGDSVCLHGEQAIRCTFSAGIATHQPGERAEQLLARADAALYRAKQAGRDQVIRDEAAWAG